MNFFFPLALVLALVALLASPPAFSKPEHKQVPATETQAERLFTDLQRAAIADYYRSLWAEANRSGTLPPGLAKRDSLPPGLQKQLVRNGRLPPGLDKEPLPSALERRLGALPKGTQAYSIGSDVILVDLARNTLLDIVSGALYGR